MLDTKGVMGGGGGRRGGDRKVIGFITTYAISVYYH
jgi:hypothetical protein